MTEIMDVKKDDVRLLFGWKINIVMYWFIGYSVFLFSVGIFHLNNLMEAVINTTIVYCIFSIPIGIGATISWLWFVGDD
jgi:hypothetical protein